MRYYDDRMKKTHKKYKGVNSYKKALAKVRGYKLYELEAGEAYIASPKYKKLNKIMTSVKRNMKKKSVITSIIAVGMAGIMIASGFFIAGKLKNKKGNAPSNSNSVSQKHDGLGTGSLDSLGEQLPKEKKKEYTKVSGDFNIEDVVRGSDGLLYDSQESADNASKVGTVDIDTKGGSLVVESDGTVYTKEEGYEIIDESGNVIESGNGSVPDNYSDGGIDYIECPSNYYDDEGNLVHSAGELITPSELEICKQYYHTTKPEKDEYVKVEEEIIYFDEPAAVGSNQYVVEENNKVEASVEEVITYEEDTTVSYSSEGVVNPDGTYTIYGVTYSSYADYQQYIIDGGAGYGYIDGIIQPIGDYEIEYQYTK